MGLGTVIFAADFKVVGMDCLDVVSGPLPAAAWAVGVGCLDVTTESLEQAEDASTVIITKTRELSRLAQRENTLENPIGFFIFMRII